MTNTTSMPAEQRACNLLNAEGYVNVDLHHTGGGVMACQLVLDGDDYVLVTDGTEFGGEAGSYAVGLYLDGDDEGEVLVCSDDAALISHIDKVFAEHVAEREPHVEFRRALVRFQVAAGELLDAWDGEVEVTDYPEYLPSFDEFVADAQGIGVNLDTAPAPAAVTPAVKGGGASYEALSDDEARRRFPDDDDVRGIGEIPPALQRTIDELIDHLDESGEQHAVVALARDWEGCAFALVSGVSGPWDVLALTDTGRIGYGGINMPYYYDTVAELVEANR